MEFPNKKGMAAFTVRQVFTCDLEDFNHGLHLPKGLHSSISSVYWLQYKLHQYKIKAIFYVLKDFDKEFPSMVSSLASDGHIIKSHGIHHFKNEEADRKPYSWLGFTGGFYLRLFPYWLIKREVIRNRLLYVHPHDLDENHPRLKNPILNWKRHVGLSTARYKLERLMKELDWECPEANLSARS